MKFIQSPAVKRVPWCSPAAPGTTNANTSRRIRHPAAPPSCPARDGADCGRAGLPGPAPRPGISLCQCSRPACTKGTSRPSSIGTQSPQSHRDALTWKAKG